jgi:hypothetical protein
MKVKQLIISILFQMTGARKHPRKEVGIDTALALLNKPHNPELCFVLLQDALKHLHLRIMKALMVK